MNWIDTAAYYGFGHAEEIVARALSGLSERPLVFTKCGIVASHRTGDAHEFRLKDWSVRAEIEASLRRLNVDSLDAVMLHWPIPDEDVEEGWSALRQLQVEGAVRYIGVSNFSDEQMARCAAIAPVQLSQPEYSLIDRSAETSVLPYAHRHQIGTIVYSPLKHGLLSGSMTRERIGTLADTDWRRSHVEYAEPRLTRNLRIVESLQAIAERHGTSIAEVAVAWTLANPCVTAAIVGGRHSSQFRRIVGAADLVLRADDLEALDLAVTSESSPALEPEGHIQ